MKNLLTITFLFIASLAFAQPVRTTITDDGVNVTVQTPVNVKVIPICDFHWVFVDGQLKMWIEGGNELIPGGRLGNFTVNGATTQQTKLDALGAISAQCAGGGAGGTLTDGNKGDVTVSDSGSVWNINAGVIGSTEIANGGVGWVDLAQAVKDSIDQARTNLGRIFYVSATGNNATAEVGNPSLPWADPGVATSLMQNGDKLQVMYPDTFLLEDGIFIDSLQNVEFDFANATLMRVPAWQRNTTLKIAYVGGGIGNRIVVDSIPQSWSVGDFIRLNKDTTDATGISRPQQITAINGDTVTIDYFAFLSRYSGDTFTLAAGKYVIKDYLMFYGRPSLNELGTTAGFNSGVVIKNAIFDDGWFLGDPTQKSYSWNYNGTMLLHGQGNKVQNCIFRNYATECILGTGYVIDGNRFENGGGSAFHYSSCQEAHNNASRGNTFINNYVRNTNQIANTSGGVNINGHNSGTIEFSCNGGEITVSGNQFIYNQRAGAKLMGILTGTQGTDNDRENIIFSNNRCFGYQGIIGLDASSHNLIIEGNILDNCGTLVTNTGSLDTIRSIKICNNLALNGTLLTVSQQQKCDPVTPASTTLDQAYGNFGATSPTVTVDAAEGQTTGLRYLIGGTSQSIEVATGDNGTWYLSRYHKGLTPRFNIRALTGNLTLSGTDAGNTVTIQTPIGTRIVRYLENRLMSYDATGADTLLASGPSRADNGVIGFNSGGTGWKDSYRFDQITSVANNRFALVEDFGPLNDAGSVQAPDGYALRTMAFTLNGSSGGRRYDVFRIGKPAIVLTTGTRTDTLCGFRWMPTITSTGGGFENWALDVQSGVSWFRAGTTVNILGGLTLSKTITAGGTTGAQTINNHSGSVNFAAAATSLVVTNSLVSTNSVIVCTVATNDTTMKSVAVVAGSGSFTIHANAAATAETRVNFLITN